MFCKQTSKKGTVQWGIQLPYIHTVNCELKALTSTESAWLAQRQKLITDVKLVLNVKNCVQFEQ